MSDRNEGKQNRFQSPNKMLTASDDGNQYFSLFIRSFCLLYVNKQNIYAEAYWARV